MEQIEGTNHEIHLTGSPDGQPRVWSNVSKRYLKKPKPIKNGYIIYSISIDRKKINFYLHRLVADYFISNPNNYPVVDHIDGNKLNNRISNLRYVTRSHNGHNCINSKGYYWHKSVNKWHSSIKVNKKPIYLGLFETEEEARKAFLEASKKYYPGILMEAN